MMNNELPRTAPETEAPESKRRQLWKRAVSILTHNWGWKIGSLVMAICLWGALISQDGALPRDKVIEGVRVNITNAATLRNNGYIVVSGLEDLNTVRIRARVPQRNYTTASSDYYTARLDLSQISGVGEQTVNITASASNAAQYGTVMEVYDSQITLRVEEYSTQANVPVEVRAQGELPDNLFTASVSLNVNAVDVSGPKAIVDQIVRCVVVYDQSVLSPERSPNTANLPFSFEDAEGNTLDASNLTATARGQSTALQRITVTQQVYYLAKVPVDTSTLIVGEPASGYAVSSIRVTPQTITLAGSQVALEPYLAEGAMLYPYEQVDISGQTRTVSQLLYLNTPGSLEYISNNTVQVVVSILPEEFVNMASNGGGTEQQP